MDNVADPTAFGLRSPPDVPAPRRRGTRPRMKTPIHVVGGFLGTGKTTVLLAELARREGTERCAVLVNDFGEARIDASLLGGRVPVTNIPGGCVCCTAPEGLVPAIRAILDELRPDRIFVEPSGLGRPRDIVDMLARGPVADRLELQPTVVLVDPTRRPADPSLFADQIDGADVLVANRCDHADLDQLAAFDQLAAAMWPAPILTAKVRFGRLPEAAWSWPAGAGPRASAEGDAPHDHGHDHDHGAAPRTDSTAGYHARSWVFPPTTVFSWDKLRELVVGTPGLERFKGVFRTDLGWFRLDLAGGVIHPADTAYRRDSRADLIVTTADLDAFDVALRAARVSDRDPDSLDGTAIGLMDATGVELPLSRGALMAMPGQVPDVGAVAPGKKGAGVRLRELLFLAGNATQYSIAAADGFVTPPAPIDSLGDAVLVHSLDGGPVPEDQGGPFRVYGAAGSSCANVKAVVRVRALG